MGILWWGLVVVLVLIMVVIKIITRKKEEDDFGNRISRIGKFWNDCCRKKKRGFGI